MKRRSLLGSIAWAALPGQAETRMAQGRKPKALLTISGLIGRVNNEAKHTYDFSEAAYLDLPTTSITTVTPWTPTSVFVGPLAVDVLRVVGVTSGILIFRALDDNSAPTPWEDLVRYGGILAHSKDGQRLTNKRWGHSGGASGMKLRHLSESTRGETDRVSRTTWIVAGRRPTANQSRADIRIAVGIVH